MSDKFQENMDKAAAFQKIWMESLSKSTEAAWTSFSSGSSPPPDVLRQMRAGLFEALGQSWEQFMRSPEFLEVMRQWMEQAVSFRKMTNDFVAKAREEAQAPSREDIENILLAVRHMEKRLLDRIESLAGQIAQVQKGKAGAAGTNRRATRRATSGGPVAKPGTRSTANGRKGKAAKGPNV